MKTSHVHPLPLIVGAVLALSTLPAGAVTRYVAPEIIAKTPGSSQMMEVNHRRDNRHMRRHWDRHVHGDRCRTRYGNCRHYYRGYYYATPWWTLPLIGGAYALGAQERRYDRYGNDHVEWCLDRYRSYNVRTNTWITYDGDVRRCRSPYM
jgi:BA14K-like protein